MYAFLSLVLPLSRLRGPLLLLLLLLLVLPPTTTNAQDVQDCYANDVAVTDFESCNNWCGTTGSFYSSSGDDGELTGVSCQCPDDSKSCEGTYELVVQDCYAEEVGVTDYETCDSWCGEQASFSSSIGDDGELTGVTCSCPINGPVTSKCEGTYELVVQDCYDEEVAVTDSGTCNSWCGEQASFSSSIGDNGELTGVTCSCPTVGPVTSKCEGTYELVVQDCYAEDVAVTDSGTCNSWCGEQASFSSSSGDNGELTGVTCSCPTVGPVTSKCEGTYTLVVQDCNDVSVSDVATCNSWCGEGGGRFSSSVGSDGEVNGITCRCPANGPYSAECQSGAGSSSSSGGSSGGSSSGVDLAATLTAGTLLLVVFAAI